MRTMYDSITAAAIPADAAIVAGYVDGRYRWSPADWARFPTARKVRIAVFASTLDGDVLDVERGDAAPADAPGWVRARRGQGADPSVYTSVTEWPTVRGEFARQGVAEPHWWIAAYPGCGPALYPGSVAHQYHDAGPYDLSVVADHWPGIDPQPPEDDDMTPDQAKMLQEVHDALYSDPHAFGLTPMWATLSSVARDVADIKARVASMHAGDYGEGTGAEPGDLRWLDHRLNAVIAKLTPPKA